MTRVAPLRCFAVFAALIVPFAGFAQEAENLGQEGLIVLPDMDSETRFIRTGVLEAPLPPLDPLPPPLEEPPYPPEAERVIPESAYRTEATLDTAARPALAETFTEASVGAGLWGGVFADLAVYRPDVDPGFSLNFSHAATDGFAFREAGEGYYQRRTSLSGRLRGAPDDDSAWSLSASFMDSSYGLQGLSQYFYGLSYRALRSRFTYRRAFFDVLAFGAEAEASSSGRSLELAQPSPPGLIGVHELSLLPRLSVEYALSDFSLSLSVLYDFKGLLGSSLTISDDDRYNQRFAAGLNTSLSVNEALALGASFSWNASELIKSVFPFSLSIEAAIKEFVSLSLAGGLEVKRLDYASLWETNPYIDPNKTLGEDGHWFTRAKADFFILPGLDASLDVGWALSLPGTGRLSFAAPSSSDARHLYAVILDEYNDLGSALAFRWRAGGAAIALGWEADWLDPPVLGEAQRLKLDAEYRSRDEGFGGALSVAADIGAVGFALPLVDASAFLKLTPELRLTAEVNDIASAFLGRSGRVVLAPYLDSGFRGAIKLRLSL